MKIIKYTMIAVVGAFLLPAPPQDEFTVLQTGQRINLETGEVVSAAISTFGDLSGFCSRQPAVCSTANQIAYSLQARAKYNFRRLYEWSASGTEREKPGNIPPLPPIRIDNSASLETDRMTTGSILPRMAEATTKPSVNTLQIEDLVPEWRGPARSKTG